MFVALGKPFLDIIAKIDGERIQKYQFENYDHVRFDHKILDDDLKDNQKIYKLGGSITNTLRTIKWISPNLDLLFIGNIGEDANGEILKRQIEEEEIRTHFWVTKVNTAKCYVLIHGDVRTLVTDSETKRSIEVDLDESLFSNASILYLSALFIPTSFKIIILAYHHFLSNNKTIVLNLGAPFISEQFPQQMLYMFNNADIVFGNENEYLALANISHIVEKDPKCLILSINKAHSGKPGRTVIMTRGSNSVLMTQNDQLSEFEVERIASEDLKDTNGAGDAFAGGFLSQFMARKSLEDCVNCGIWASGQVVKNVGFDFDKNAKYCL